MKTRIAGLEPKAGGLQVPASVFFCSPFSVVTKLTSLLMLKDEGVWQRYELELSFPHLCVKCLDELGMESEIMPAAMSAFAQRLANRLREYDLPIAWGRVSFDNPFAHECGKGMVGVYLRPVGE